MQLAIYEYYNGPILSDVTYQAFNVEFSTNKYGFGYCKFNLDVPLAVAATYFRLTKTAYVRLGTAEKSYFEGRLEDIQYGDTLFFTAFGYFRAFSDIQLNELWSTTDVSRFKVLPITANPTLGVAQNNNDPNLFQTSNQGSLYQALQKNTSAVVGKFSHFYISCPPKASRTLKTVKAVFNLKNTATVSTISAFQSLNSTYGALLNEYVITTSVSGYRESFTKNLANPTYNAAFLLYTKFNALYIGETGDLSAKWSDVRVGTTTSISGSALYADEVLRDIVSQVNTLNPTQLSSVTTLIQSPQFDITDLIFENTNGTDAINLLLSFPSSTGELWECKVWENQRVIFRPKTTGNTWYVSFTETKLNRSLSQYINQVKAEYKNSIGEETHTSVTVPSTTGINRQSVVKFEGVSATIAANLASAKITDSQRKAPQSELEIQYARKSTGGFFSAIEIRSGDKIIIEDIPPELFSLIDNTFIVDETICNMDTGVIRIIPEKPLAQLETLLSRIEL